MKRLLHGAVLTVLFTVGLGSTAFASVALELVAGSGLVYSTLYVDSVGTATCNNYGGSLACSGLYTAIGGSGAITLANANFDGFHIQISSGGSNSPNCSGFPNGPGCLNTTNITATNIGSGTATIKAYFADTGFTPAGTMIVGFSTPGETGTTAMQQAYATTGAVNPLGIGVLNPAAGLIVCGLPLTINGPTGNTSLGTNCAAPALSGIPPQYSLELETTMTTGPGGSFNLNGTISNVPEPVSVALFGTILALCASGLRRRRKLS